jgi:signal transduction histidine kinase
MVDADQAARDVDERIEDVVIDEGDPGIVAVALADRRSVILEGWMTAAQAQPFHQEKPQAAVADHIPALFDAIMAVLKRSSRRNEVLPPMDDDAVIAAAGRHAEARFEQGLGPVAIVTEFRLLRHEISRALGAVVDDVRATDLLAGQAIIDDALDGAAAVGLSSLSERIESLREGFLATTLHDIRQPITLVTGSLDLASRWLAAPTPDTARVSRVVDDAVIAVGEINAMLDTLGDASRIAMGALEPDPEPAALATIVHEAIGLLDPDTRSRIHVVGADDRRIIGVWDPHLLRRVVGNLLGNAAKYSEAPATIEVSIGIDDTGLARLVIRDHGMGMTADELERSFERFGRADRARTSGIPGLGLGLYACRGIVDAHGGTIEARSDGPGRGSTMVVRLPLGMDSADGDAG